jgi:hypothetical protein
VPLVVPLSPVLPIVLQLAQFFLQMVHLCSILPFCQYFISFFTVYDMWAPQDSQLIPFKIKKEKTIIVIRSPPCIPRRRCLCLCISHHRSLVLASFPLAGHSSRHRPLQLELSALSHLVADQRLRPRCGQALLACVVIRHRLPSTWFAILWPDRCGECPPKRRTGHEHRLTHIDANHAS